MKTTQTFELVDKKHSQERIQPTALLSSPFIGNNVLSQYTGGGQDNGQMQASHWPPGIPPGSSLANQRWNLRQEKLQQEMVRLNNGGCLPSVKYYFFYKSHFKSAFAKHSLLKLFHFNKSTTIYSSRKATS